MSLATTDDVEVSLGRPLTSNELDRATNLLDRVEARILEQIPDLEAQIAATPSLLDAVIEIESDAVARVLRNPDGLLQEQDGDYGYTRDRRLASGALGLTDEEWARLGKVRGAFTIRPYLATPDVSEDALWASLP